MGRNVILYFGKMDLPFNNASASRVMGISSLLQSCGIEVFCYGYSKNEQPFCGDVDGVHIKNEKYPEKFIGYIKVFGNSKNIRKTIGQYSKNDIKAIFFTSIGHINLKFLVKYCKTNKIPLIYDCGDIIRSSTKGFPFNIVSKIEYKIFNKYVKKHCSVMAISTFIENYYKNKAVSIFNIPCIASSKSAKYVKTPVADLVDEKYINIFYCGDSGKNFCKDRVDLIVEEFAKLNSKNLKLYLAGVDQKMFDVSESNVNIVFLGKISNEKCISYMKQMDLTILFRDDNEMTRAGFPSKITESLMCGIPIACNLTSDLGKYLNTNNAILVDGFGAEKCKELFAKIQHFEKKDLELMKKSIKKDNPLESNLWAARLLDGINEAQKKYE